MSLLLPWYSAFALLMPVVLFVTVYWGRRLSKRHQAEQVRAIPEVTEHVLVPEWMRAAGGMGRALPTEGSATSTGLVEIPLRPPVLERTWWSWFKLTLGGVGLSFSALLLLGACEGIQGRNETWGLAVLAGVLAVGSFLLFRSGLRGPFASAPVS